MYIINILLVQNGVTHLKANQVLKKANKNTRESWILN